MGQVQHDKEAFVTIGYDDDGNPVADPPELHVKHGTRITWTNDPSQDREFTLDFDDRVPEPGPPRKRLEARKENGAYRASIIATPAPPDAATPQAQGGSQSERYDYAVRAGDRASDPAIIIDK